MRSCLTVPSSSFFFPSKTPFLNHKFRYNSSYPSLITYFRPRNPNVFASSSISLHNVQVSWVPSDPNHEDDYNGWAVVSEEIPIQNKKKKGGNFILKFRDSRIVF